MPWVRLDDGLAEHRKTRRLLRAGGHAAMNFHLLAIVHSAKYLTDGHVDNEFIADMCEVGKVKPKERARILDALVECGQWAVDELRGGWIIHDYLSYNPSRVKVLADRERDAARKARGRGTVSAGNDPGPEPESDGCPPGHVPDSARIPSSVRASRPDPTRPTPTNNPPDPPRGETAELPSRPPTGNRRTDRERWEQQAAAWARSRWPDELLPSVIPLMRTALGKPNATEQTVVAYVEEFRQQTTAERVAGGMARDFAAGVKQINEEAAA